MRSVSCLLFGFVLFLFSMPAHAQDGRQALRIVVGTDGGVKVIEVRTGNELPCIVTRHGDKPAVVRVIEGSGATVREFSVDTTVGNVINIPGIITQEEDRARKELDKQLQAALKELEARRKHEQEQRIAAEKALAEFRKQAEDARAAAELRGQEAIKALELIAKKKDDDARKLDIETRKKLEMQLDALKKDLEKHARQEAEARHAAEEANRKAQLELRKAEDEARKREGELRKQLELQLDETRKELQGILNKQKEDARKKEDDARKQAEEARNAKFDSILKELRELHKDINDLKKRIESKQEKKGLPMPKADPANSLEQRLDRILQEAEALRRELLKLKM